MATDIVGIVILMILVLCFFLLLYRLEGIEEKLEKVLKNKEVVNVQNEPQVLVCPDCNKKDIKLISESRKTWWCNPCNKFFKDKT